MALAHAGHRVAEIAIGKFMAQRGQFPQAMAQQRIERATGASGVRLAEDHAGAVAQRGQKRRHAPFLVFMEKVRFPREMPRVFAQGCQLKGQRTRIALIQKQQFQHGRNLHSREVAHDAVVAEIVAALGAFLHPSALAQEKSGA